MQTVYKADHVAEAQIVVDVLAGEDIRAWIHGAGLPGAAGDLPAFGLVDVAVADADAATARAAIARWKATPTQPDAPLPAAAPRGSAYGTLLAGLVAGALLGTLATYAVLRRPNTDRVDYDDDGHAEETWYYDGDYVARVDYDRNSDGTVDAQMTYGDEYGESTYVVDDDFDGRFETYSLNEEGETAATRSDRDGDGFLEHRATYRHGVIVKDEMFDPKTGKVVLAYYYAGGWPDRSRIDTDGDGVLDQERTHDARGEIVATKPLAQ